MLLIHNEDSLVLSYPLCVGTSLASAPRHALSVDNVFSQEGWTMSGPALAQLFILPCISAHVVCNLWLNQLDHLQGQSIRVVKYHFSQLICQCSQPSVVGLLLSWKVQ